MSYLRGTGITFRFNQNDNLSTNRPPEQVGFVSGCAVLLKCSTLKTVGLLDEDFFFGVEDADFSWRLTKAGFQMIYVPHAIIWHKKSSSRSFSQGEFYNAIVSKAILMQKHLPKVLFYFWWLGYSIKTSLTIPLILKFLQKKHQLPASKTKEIRYVILKGLYRGFSPNVKSGFDPVK
jgi:GT2 family glycosyltransferase